MENWATEACSWTLEKKRNRWKSLAGAVLGIALLCTNAAGALAETDASESTDKWNNHINYPGTREILTEEGLRNALKSDGGHRVSGITPPGTTLNLFDYVASHDGAVENDLSNGGSRCLPDVWNTGINQNRLLLFGDSMLGAGYWNIGAGAGREWARTNTNMRGIVQQTLDESGYPVINMAGAEQTLAGTGDIDISYIRQVNDANYENEPDEAIALSEYVRNNCSDPSLAYLFDLQPVMDNAGKEVKRIHKSVTGLFQVDDEGYYYYDARQNFAEYDEDSNSFILYDGPAVWRSDGAWNKNSHDFSGSKSLGNFFPFNKGEQVFDCIDQDGCLCSSVNLDNINWSDTNDPTKQSFVNKATQAPVLINHHMGMSMTVDFAQPENGTIKMGKAGEKDMVFQFSGDDDVWVFVDDVLVLDLGGIHSELYGTINFATGEVITGQGWRYENGMPDRPGEGDDIGSSRKTLYELFEKALIPSDPKVTNGWTTSSAGNRIFATGTSHTLKLFYLERGNYDSSLHMKFNLQPPLSHSIRKVDQDGEPLEGAKFNLYAAKLKDGSTENSKEGCANAADYETVDAPIGTFTTDKDGMATLARTARR